MIRPAQPSGRTRTALLALNATGALVAAGFAAGGLIRPSIAEHRSVSDTTALTQFWAASSAIRTLAVSGPLLVALSTNRSPSPQILTAAGITQLGDALLGIRQRNAFMTTAPAVMGVVHLVTARVLAR